MSLERRSRLRTSDLLQLSFHGLQARPMRAVLSSLGIAIGIAAMISVIGISTSSQALIQDKLAALGAFDVLRRESVNFELRAVAERALQAAEQMRAVEDRTKSDPIIPPQPSDDLIIGRSPAMQDV